MKNIAVIWSLIGIVLWAGMAAANPSALSSYLPTERDLPGWKMDEEPQAAEGTELFSLIDGAAETHLEYGFVRAIMQTYSNAQDELVQVEIYEMRDAAAAYGIYTFHAGDEAKPTDIGDEGVLGEYYVMFWKGAFFVMISGSESDAAQEAMVRDSQTPVAPKKPGWDDAELAKQLASMLRRSLDGRLVNPLNKGRLAADVRRVIQEVIDSRGTAGYEFLRIFPVDVRNAQ